MQPIDVQLLLLGAALAAIISGLPAEARHLVLSSMDEKGNDQLLLGRDNQNMRYDVDGLPQSQKKGEIDFLGQQGNLLECFVHTESWKDVMKLTCDRETVGCITRVNITQDGWHGLLPPSPFKEHVCLNITEAQRRPIGKCDCVSLKCICYCRGSSCNSRERITAVIDDNDSVSARRHSGTSWTTIMLIAGAVIIVVIVILVMFAVCGQAATRRTRRGTSTDAAASHSMVVTEL